MGLKTCDGVRTIQNLLMSRLVAAPLEEEGLRHRGEVAEAGSRSGSEETPGEEGQTFWGQDASFLRKDPPFQLIACLQK